MFYKKYKREKKISICNICLEKRALTWDHIPPKGGVDITTVKQENILQKLTYSTDIPLYSLSQNGVKYRTICKICNENLGSYYDDELNNFAISIRRIFETQLILPSIMHFKIKPNKIIKAVYGHLLAAKVDIENTKIDESLRAMFFDEEDPPLSLKLYYWLYPYKNFIIIRDILMPAQRGNFKDFGSFSILKYFPIAFLVTELNTYSNLNELTKYKSKNIEEELEIPVNLKKIKHPFWPEKIEGNNFLIGGQSLQSAIYATPLKKK